MDRKQSDPRELLPMIFTVSLRNRSQAELSADRYPTQIDILLNMPSKITQ